ncbi:MAG: hypothetical protein LBL74_04415 [Bacteroidales bacterium]|nr:hypothetical protein [Bacteroidales bacterium]
MEIRPHIHQRPLIIISIRRLSVSVCLTQRLIRHYIFIERCLAKIKQSFIKIFLDFNSIKQRLAVAIV